MVAALNEMQDRAYVPSALPEELESTNRILQRWAVSIGIGLPTDEWDETPKSRPPPLDDGTAIVVDQIVTKSPPLTRDLIREWYKKPTPCPTMARNRHLGLKALYFSHRTALFYVKWKFETSNYPQLMRLLTTRVFDVR